MRTLPWDRRYMSSTDAIAWSSMLSRIAALSADARTMSSPSDRSTLNPARMLSSFSVRCPVREKPDSSRSPMVSPRSVNTRPPESDSPTYTFMQSLFLLSIGVVMHTPSPRWVGIMFALMKSA